MAVPHSFSPNGEYFAYSSPDGILKLWDSATGTLKQEYTPSSHLSSTCTCLSFAPTRHTSDTPRKKKKKRRSSLPEAGPSSGGDVDLIALGTSSGTILLYSLLKGDLQTQLVGGHTDAVHSVCWHNDGETLFSCSADGNISQWNLTTGAVMHKWKGDRGSIYSISLLSTGHHLLSAGRSIKLWDLHTRQVLKTYSGHATEVFQLLPLPCESCRAEQNGATSQDIPNTYFLSAALNDRLLHAWHINPTSKTKSAVASFSLPDEPVQMVMGPLMMGQVLILAAVTKSGQLLLFEHILNGQLKKPLKPKVTVQIATDGTTDTPRPIPVIGTHLCADADSTVILTHGNFIKPTFEKMRYDSLTENMCLIRQDPNQSVMKTQVDVSKVRTPEVSQDVTVLAPGHMAPIAPTQQTTDQAEPAKRKRQKSITGELSLNERLNAISVDGPSSNSKHPPRADNLAILLAQGLQSQDKKMLNSVLQHTNDSVIRNTVKRLPVPVIVPLVKELSRRMHGHAQSGHVLVKWMKTVLTIHTSFLMTFPELVGTLSSIYQMMDSRVSLFSRLSRLQGKLDLMLSQITSQTEQDEDAMAAQQPMLLYQDESSSEDDLVEEDTGSEENWEDDDEEDEMDEEDEEMEEGKAEGGGESEEESMSDSD